VRTSDWTDSAAVLDRLTALLEAFDDEDAGMGVSELARRANLPKSTVSRACTELVRHGLLDRQGDRLHLGIRLFEWGQAVEVPRTFRRLARPTLNELRDLTGQTVRLAVLEETTAVIVAVAAAVATRSPAMRVGARLPLHATALGRALLAWSPDRLAERVIDDGLSPRTPRTVRTGADLRAHLAEARRTGSATEAEEHLPGHDAAAVPVLASGRRVVAALSVEGPSGTVHLPAVLSALRAAGVALGRRVDADASC
jgi:DNA-binding IclR family transcriptional regulator